MIKLLGDCDDSDSDDEHETRWQNFLDQVEVYALTMPERAEHIEGVLQSWGFDDAIIFYGILKETINLKEWAKHGRIDFNENVTLGRVACHFGHRAIMEDFCEAAPKSKKWVLIFEDDLMASPAHEMQVSLLDFMDQVPQDFDICHLGFLWESRADRVQINDVVCKTHMAVGRHAYILTRYGAKTLLEATYPQDQAGDEMYKLTISQRKMAAYQPVEPLFHQDRKKFISRILGYNRPARPFRPDAEALKKWQNEAAESRKKSTARSEAEHKELKQRMQEIDAATLKHMRARLEDRHANPEIDFKEPLLLVGTSNDWSPDDAMKSFSFTVAEVRRGENPFVGRWHYDDTTEPLVISMDFDGQLRVSKTRPNSKEEECAGDVHPQQDGNIVMGDLNANDGDFLGTIRFRFVPQEGPEGSMLMQFRSDGQTDFSPEAPIWRHEGDQDGTEVEHHLPIRVKGGTTDFQIISRSKLWNWRLFPASAAPSMVLKKGERTSVPAGISVGSDDMTHHGRNFSIKEPAGGKFVVKVVLKRRGRLVWYDSPPANSGATLAQSSKAQAYGMPGLGPGIIPGVQMPHIPGVNMMPGMTGMPPMHLGVPGMPPGMPQFAPPQRALAVAQMMDVAEAANELEDEEVTSVLSSMRIVEPDQYYLSEIVPVRLVGECVKWNVRAKGLEFHQQPPSTSNEGWWEYRLCCRLQGDRIDFQVVSSQLGFRWRCFPRGNGLCRLPRGTKNNVVVSVGGDNDGHGCNFSVQEAPFAIVTIAVWLKPGKGTGALPGEAVSEVMVTYTLEDTGLTVGIGPTHVQYPARRPRRH